MLFLQEAFELIPALERVLLYGSRARQTHRLGSDIDLALQGSAISFRDILRLQAHCEAKSPALLRYDVVHFDALTEKGEIALRQNIERDGVAIYQRCSE
jgi:predicted nucleotidyltransferase